MAAASGAAQAGPATGSGPSPGDWPEFRGPTGQGHASAKDLPLEWGPAKNVAWRKALPGKGWSSPVLWKGRVYLTTAIEEGGKLSLRALCVDASSGHLRWDAEVFSHERSGVPGIHSKNGHASPTPVVEDGRVYVHFGHLGTACLDLDGKVLWRQAALRYAPAHGSGGSPAVAGELLVLSCDGSSDPFVVALEKGTGDVRWRTPRSVDARKKFSFSTPLLIEVGGRAQVVVPGSDAACAYDPSSGRELWRVRYEGFSVVPRPVCGHGLVYFATGYEEPRVLAVRPDGQGDVTGTHVAWSVRKGAPNTPSLLVAGGDLFMVSDVGVASCLDARTGSVHWQKRVCGSCSASPVLAAGRIYVIDEDGLCVVLKPGRTFETLAENDLGERTLASLAVGERELYIRTEKALWRIEERQRPASAGSPAGQ
ncbi:MAG: PQQ-binding-like beta-propeller repeat protein [Planctomycetes bacterium]|nr:PQQ-binding-like beta-propeller repeat protein [Planctomycetota bacterium]